LCLQPSQPLPGVLDFGPAGIVRPNARKNILTYVNFNNHYEGSAPLSIRRFLETLGPGVEKIGT
jgi:hypothetical protein